MTIIAYHIIK